MNSGTIDRNCSHREGRSVARYAARQSEGAVVKPAASLQELDAVVRLHGDRLLAIARRYFACDADCADAVQDALTAAVRHLPRFRGGCKLETWLFRIVVNACLMKLRKRSRQATMPLESCEESAPAASREFPLSREETRQMVRKALSRLSESQRAVIQLRYFEGFNTEETAELLGLQKAAVKTRLHRSCRALGRLLKCEFDQR
jgi:RNA polymerase sigma-70 factor (ECF subfamily)